MASVPNASCEADSHSNPRNLTNHTHDASSPACTSFLEQVERTVHAVLTAHNMDYDDDQGPDDEGPYQTNVQHLEPSQREPVLISRCLAGRIRDARNSDVCPHCWLQRPFCYCAQCPPIENLPGQPQLFLVLHYRELCMGVDTAKLILSTFPRHTQLVIAGIPAEFQPSMAALEEALKTDRSLVLFPDESAQTFAEYSSTIENEGTDDTDSSSTPKSHQPWNIIVIDGTWQQARRIKLRYFDLVPKIKLSDQALQILGEETSGHQLRKHSIPWKKIATFEAVRLLLVDWFQKEWSDPKDPSAPWSKIRDYVEIANKAALARKKDNASW